MLSQFLNIAIAVNDIDAAIKRYNEAFGWTLDGEVKTQESLGIKTAILSASGLSVELLSPLPGETVLRRFLDTRGEGFYRLAFSSDDCDAALEHFDKNGVRYVDLSADGGQRVVFTAPKSTHGIMVELVASADSHDA